MKFYVRGALKKFWKILILDKSNERKWLFEDLLELLSFIAGINDPESLY